MIAICFYGSAPSDEIRKIILDKFGKLEFKIFESYDTDTFKSLEVVSFKKRDYELENNIEFSLCVAIHTDDIELMKNFNILNLKFTQHNTIYFMKGYFSISRYKTGINPEIFFAKSSTFDRICEFYTNQRFFIDRHWVRGQLEEVFYYHVKSLIIKAACINYENSNLFIRTA